MRGATGVRREPHVEVVSSLADSVNEIGHHTRVRVVLRENINITGICHYLWVDIRKEILLNVIYLFTYVLDF